MTPTRPRFSIFALSFIGLALASCAPATTDKTADDAAAITAPAGLYKLDPAHASLVFKIDHLGFSFYTSSFASFDAVLHFDPAAPEAMSVEASIDVASLRLPTPPPGFFDTLMGEKWLRADTHPEITFASTAVTPTGTRSARVDGVLTLLGASAPVAMEVNYLGGYPGFLPYDPQARIGFSAHGTFKRSDFGFVEGLPPEGSTMGVGDDVAFDINAEFRGPPTPDPEAPPPESQP